MTTKTTQKFLTFVVTACLCAAPAAALAKEVTVGYQGICNPWKWKIAEGAFEKETGYKINWTKFDSGGAVMNAMASGDVHVAVAGSSPIAAGISRGVDVQLFWILEDIASAEALVVRNGSGIVSPQDLKGKTIGVPFVSTTHFHMLFALEQFGITPKDVDIRNMQPNAIASAWEGGQIDGAFVWDPALGRIKKTGKVLITSGQLSSWGKATFDGMVVDTKWGKANKDFMAKFIKIIDEANEDYRSDPSSWTPDSAKVKAAEKLSGCSPADVPGIIALFGLPTMEVQASKAWLGGGKEGGGAKALYFTSEFLKNEKKLDALQPDYGKFVTNEYVKAAMNL
ncbi:MAG: taurine ABC transporter substrate-binding protein [Betaproteobacteria bacterium]|nr:taurine ABC transporter substrate-binding protein [Betaproteobacteria bacterium]